MNKSYLRFGLVAIFLVVSHWATYFAGYRTRTIIYEANEVAEVAAFENLKIAIEQRNLSGEPAQFVFSRHLRNTLRANFVHVKPKEKDGRWMLQVAYCVKDYAPKDRLRERVAKLVDMHFPSVDRSRILLLDTLDGQR